MKFLDRTVRQVEPDNEYNEPRRGRPAVDSPAPVTSNVPGVDDAFRKAREVQKTADANVAAVLGNVPEDIAAEVIGRLSVDDRFYPAIRATKEQPALRQILAEVQQERRARK